MTCANIGRSQGDPLRSGVSPGFWPFLPQSSVKEAPGSSLKVDREAAPDREELLGSLEPHSVSLSPRWAGPTRT